MTLISGIRGFRKCYITSDSRETRTYPDGKLEYFDGAQKWVYYGKRAMSAAAGDAMLAAHISKKILNELGSDPSFSEVKALFDIKLRDFATDYNVQTGRFCSCVLMLSGFDQAEKEEFDAARLGEVMSADIVKQGEGKMMNQSIPPELLHSMRYAIVRAEAMGKQPAGRGTKVPVDAPRSYVVGYKVSVTPNGVEIVHEEADNFQVLFYGADSAFHKIELPDDILSRIYFRDASGMTGVDILYADTMEVFTFTHLLIKQRGYSNVGGAIFPQLVTPNAITIEAGQISKLNLKTKQVEVVRESRVVDGKIIVQDTSGNDIEYRSLLDIDTGTVVDLMIEI